MNKTINVNGFDVPVKEVEQDKYHYAKSTELPATEWKPLSTPMNQEHVQMWQSCHDDTLVGDRWLINLFANEWYCMKKCDCDNGCPDCSTSLIDFSC